MEENGSAMKFNKNSKKSIGIRAQLSLMIALVSLLTISIISFLSNYFIHTEFESYLSSQQSEDSKQLAADISQAYTAASGEWDNTYMHNVGMSAIYDGYIIKIYNSDGEKIWDAEECDLGLCNQVMKDMAERMKEQYPNLNGEFISSTYTLTQNGTTIGSMDLTYYGPYYLSEADSKFLSGLNRILLGTGIFSLLCSVMIGVWFAGRITRPITKTIDVTKQISAGDYEIAFHGKTRTKELDGLMESVNHLADALKRQEHLRKQMTADVSHELRTPLTSVATHLEAMMLGIWEPTLERLNSCHEEILRITGIVKDLEYLARVEGEPVSLKKSVFDLQEIAVSVNESLAVEMQAKRQNSRIIGGRVMVNADKDRMTQVVFNLCSNAVKYTPENGQITVRLAETEAEAVLSVEDTGIGIPEQETEYIFERFYRTEKSRSRKSGGAGIGLAIAKNIVEAHGGTIEVQSREGIGSIFRVYLPK